MEEKLFDNKQQQESWDVFKLLVGQTFTNLTILNARIRFNKKVYVLAQCSCGTVDFFRLDGIKSGEYKSCGCYSRFKKGQTPWNLGVPMSEESKQKDSESHKGLPGYWKGKKRSPETIAKMSAGMKGKIPWSAGLKMSPESIEKNRLAHLGKKPWNFGKTTPDDVRKKQSLVRMGRFAGENSPSWKGGITPENTRLRTNIEYRRWRREVFQNADYTCLISGKRGKELQAHHILNFSAYPELRTEPQNGVCVSKEMHKMFHDFYGRANNTIEQIIEYYFLMNLYRL